MRHDDWKIAYSTRLAWKFTIVEPWSSAVEGGEGSYLPKGYGNSASRAITKVV